MERLHGGKQMRDEVLVRRGEDFVADGDPVDDRAGVERQNVSGHPGLSRRELGEGRNVTVSDGDGDGDLGVGEGAEHVGVGVEDFDAVDGGFGLEEGRHLGGRREVISYGAVVDADGVSGRSHDVAGGDQEEEEEELGRCGGRGYLLHVSGVENLKGARAREHQRAYVES